MQEDKGYTNPHLLSSPKELIDRLDRQSICIVDARPTHEYVAGHIPNAIHLDLYSLSLNDTSDKPFKAFMSMMVSFMDPRELLAERIPR